MNTQTIENAITYGIKHGADHCEIFFTKNQGFSLKIRDRQVNTYEREDARGYSVRLLKNGALGFSYGVDPTLNGIEKVIDDALAAADFLEPEPDHFFTAPGYTYPSIDFRDGMIRDTSLTDKIALAKTIYKQSSGQKAIQKVEHTSYGENTQEVILVNSLGLAIGYTRDYCFATAAVIAAQEETAETGSAYQLLPSYSQLNPEKIAAEAVADGRGKLGAKKIPTADYPVIFHPQAFLDIFSLLMPSFLGDRVWKKKSLLENKIGETIAPKNVNFFSDGLWIQGINSSPFDDEGVPCRKIQLLKDGRILQFLYDNKNGKRAGKASTGNGYGSFKSWPSVAYNNFYFAPGDTPVEKIIGSQQKTVYIRSLMGLHTANPLTGDFSLGVKGHLIENGGFSHPIAGVAVAGNILTLLKAIVAVSTETESFGHKAAPHVLVDSLKISGE